MVLFFDRDGPATGRELELLQPFAGELLPGALEGYALPVSDGSVRNRDNIRKATDLLAQAGWNVDASDGILKNAEGKPFTFEILLANGSAENKAITDIYVEALQRLGIKANVNSVDSAQYKERTAAYDFDMTYYRVGLSLSPGNEQWLYWGSAGVTEPGSKNWMGMNSPAAEAMIDRILNSQDRDDFVAATRALDRILTTGRYVIPIYQWNVSWIAHSKNLHYPKQMLPQLL